MTAAPTADAIREAAAIVAMRRAEDMPVYDRFDEAECSAYRASSVLISGMRQVTVIVPYVMMGILSRSPETAESQADSVGTVILDLAVDQITQRLGLDLPEAHIRSLGGGVVTLDW